MDTLVFIYFILSVLLIIAGIVFGFLWHISQLQLTIKTILDESKEERQNLITQLMDQLQLHGQERRQLYDRIQAGTLPQYKEYVDDPNEIEEKVEEPVDLDEAREELQPEENTEI